MQLDHIILRVTDAGASAAFYGRILGFAKEGEQGPFTILRVAPTFTLQLAPWGTGGGEHFAFAMTKSEFEAAFTRIREDGVPYGDSFHTVGNQNGPGPELGARGAGLAVYFFDPDRHLIEIRHYE